MIDFTFTAWVVLGLVFVLGWLLGLASRNGGAKYRRELEAERRAHEIYRRDHDARYAELERNRPATAVHTDRTVVHDDRSAIGGLDMRHDRHDRDDRTVVRDEVDEHGRTVIRPNRL